MHASCPTTDVSLRKNGYKSTIAIHMGHYFYTPLHDTWRSGSREICWGVILVEILWTDLGVKHSWVVFSEVVSKIFLT